MMESRDGTEEIIEIENENENACAYGYKKERRGYELLAKTASTIDGIG